MAFGGSEYNDWGIVAGCCTSQSLCAFLGGARIAVGIVDHEIGLLAFEKLGGVGRSGGFQGFGALSLQQSSQDIASLG